MKEKIEAKDGSLKGSMASQGTTPRRLTDLIGSLCDRPLALEIRERPSCLSRDISILLQSSKTESAADGRFSACSAAFFYAGSETGPWMYVSLAAAAMTMRHPRSVFPWSLDSRNFS